jgi:ABC-type sugar transport system ATPase subunit
VTVGLRPEGLALAAAGEAGTLAATVEFVEELGSDGFVYAALAGGERIVVRNLGRSHPQVGAEVGLRVVPELVHLFDAVSGVRW